MVLHLNGTEIKSSNTMNILGVIFDSKLQWCSQVAYSIKKANNALNAIKLIKHFSTEKKLLGLVTSNYYLILYYNSEIWHLHKLSPRLKQQLITNVKIGEGGGNLLSYKCYQLYKCRLCMLTVTFHQLDQGNGSSVCIVCKEMFL